MISPKLDLREKQELDQSKIFIFSKSNLSLKNRKRKKNSDNINNEEKNTEKSESAIKNFSPLTLLDIYTKLNTLSSRIPNIPSNGLDSNNLTSVKKWATRMNNIIEEFNLLLYCVPAATYKWGCDRSGAADQNLNVLSSELSNSQEQISSSVTPRLTNILSPVVEIVIKKVVTKRNGLGFDIRENEFLRVNADPAFLSLCFCIICKNAFMLRNILLTNFYKIQECIKDYLKATIKDNDSTRGDFIY